MKIMRLKIVNNYLGTCAKSQCMYKIYYILISIPVHDILSCVCCVATPGAVYRGKYRNENVAVKEFLTQAQAESGYDDYDDMGGAQVMQVHGYVHTHVRLYESCVSAC